MQARGKGNRDLLEAERQRFRALTTTGTKLKFVNPLTDITDHPQRWKNPEALLDGVDGTLWTGSLDLNIPQKTDDLQLHMDSVTPLAQAVLERDFPTVGVCFGHQTFVAVAGGRVEQIPERREKGTVKVNFTPIGREEPLFDGMPDTTRMIFSHMDSAAEIPSGAVILGKTGQDPHSMLRLRKNVITMQGHPELTDEDIPPASLTHDLVQPDQTSLIIVNFFNRVAGKSIHHQAA